jgi:hypothetical protein
LRRGERFRSEQEENMQTIFYALASLALAVWVANAFYHAGRDATDGDKKSGLFLYTDYGTGVQYVGTMYGGLSPRMDKNGKIMVE